jgi:hypothetical protein
MEQNRKGTPAQRIEHSARTWRERDKESIADKGDDVKKRAEFLARQKLREVIDTAREN